MILFDANDLSKVDEIIDKNIKNFIAANVGKFALSNNDKNKLKDAGIDIENYSDSTIVSLAYKFGIFSVSSDMQYTKDLSLYQFEKIVKSNKFLPLSTKEQSSLQSIQQQTATGIDSFGSKLLNKFRTVLSELNEKKRIELQDKTAELTKLAIQKRESVKELASNLYHFADDITRDLIRVSQYMLHSANEYGSADEIERVYGVDAKVYKTVLPGSCKKCIELYLTKGFNSEPRYFTVKELRINGDNIGVPQKQWKPTLAATHPFCRCMLTVVPKYLKWDENKKKFETNIDKYKNQQEINRLQTIIAEKRGLRGILELKEIKKSFYSMITNKTTETLQKDKIKSPYKCVNEYEKEFSLRLGKVVTDCLKEVENLF